MAVASSAMLGGDLGRHDDDAVGVADDHVAREHRSAAAADRHIDVDGLVQGQVGRRRRPLVEGRHGHFGDLGAVTKAAVGDDTGHAAHHQAPHQDAAGRGRARHRRGCP
jgi:hypothetical protein